MCFKLIKDMYQRCKLWLVPLEKSKVKEQAPSTESGTQTNVKAWIGHEGSPKQKCCLIGAHDEAQALSLIQNYDNFEKDFAVVERISAADFLFDNQTSPVLDIESDDKALYYFLVT